jgi:hypothetical protein
VTAIATLLVVLTISLLTVRVATVMLILTGLSLPLARFQARSAFTGCGYTTGESEQIVGHPVRRRIISTLMLLGNAGIVTTVGALLAGLLASGNTKQIITPIIDEESRRVAIDPEAGTPLLEVEEIYTGTPLWARLALLVGGVAALWSVASSKAVERVVNRWTFQLLKRYTKLEIRDYSNLMHLSGAFGISELVVRGDDWLHDRPLKELRLSSEGVLVLGINRRDGSYLGAPQADTVPRDGDTLIMYGASDRLAEIDRRRNDEAGQLRHLEAVADQRAKTAVVNLAEATDDSERAAADSRRQHAEAARVAIEQEAVAVDESRRT